MSDAEDPVALARRLAEQAKQRAAAPAGTSPEPKRASLLDRAPKPLTAREALQKALAEEAAREADQAAQDAARRAAVDQARQLAEQARRQAPAKAAHAVTPSVLPSAAPTPARVDVGEVVRQRLPGFELVSTHPVGSAEAFRAVWTGNRVRAALEDDFGLLVTADVLLDAATRVPPGALVGVRLEREGAAWALFVDGSRGVLLALLPRPEIHLAGL